MSTKNFTLGDWIQCSGLIGLVFVNHHFDVLLLDFIHRGIQYHFAIIDENQMGQQILNLIDLVSRDDDRLVFVEVIIQQMIVERFTVKDIESKCWLIQSSKGVG